MAGYGLLGSYSTVQVLSPTVLNDVVYCTIQTDPSNVIASMPVQQGTFDNAEANVDLGNFADAIEQIMALDEIIAGVGVQSIDTNGLLADNVEFTVQYTPPGSVGTSLTAEVLIPVLQLNFTDAEIGRALLSQVEAQIQVVSDNLQAAAAG
jgi:hypothetical protein